MKIQIVREVACAYDHVNTRMYQIGESYEVGEKFMPEWLAEQLLNGYVPLDVGIALLQTSENASAPPCAVEV